MILRPYQQEAVDAAIAHMKRFTDPCVIEAPTGAGKSYIIAALAAWLTEKSSKKVLVIAPSRELVVQDFDKYRLTGNPASFYSASVGEKSLRHPVIFGTPMTIKNGLDSFKETFCAVIIDEAHGITPTIKHVIKTLREGNDTLRVIGLTATPYRLGTGYIYKMDEDGRAHDEDRAKDPYFSKRVYAIDARELIAAGYLTPPQAEVSKDAYDTSSLKLSRMGRFDSREVDRAFVGKGRLTSKIVEDVVRLSRDRMGVMIFAATIEHAEEVMESLPCALSELVTGKTKKKDRLEILRRFKARELKYLVNVQVLTTGFDASHVDVVALLRATESVGLMQQIIGRGLRVHPDKKDCLVLDYAGNIERHCPDGDIFSPDIKAKKDKESRRIEVSCPDCDAINTVSLLPDEIIGGHDIDANGYLTDLAGNRLETPYGGFPAHHQRRCSGLVPHGNGALERCGYRWSFKPCEECGEENDIAARYCAGCKEELIDPNQKLSLRFEQFKKDPTNIQTDVVESWRAGAHISRAGRECVRIRVKTEWRSFTSFMTPGFGRFDHVLNKITSWHNAPRTVTYVKKGRFYNILDVNQDEDKIETAV